MLKTSLLFTFCSWPSSFIFFTFVFINPYLLFIAVIFIDVNTTIPSFLSLAAWGQPGAEQDLHCFIIPSLLNQIWNFDVLVSVNQYIRVQVLVRRDHVWNLFDWGVLIRGCYTFGLILLFSTWPQRVITAFVRSLNFLKIPFFNSFVPSYFLFYATFLSWYFSRRAEGIWQLQAVSLFLFRLFYFFLSFLNFRLV